VSEGFPAEAGDAPAGFAAVSRLADYHLEERIGAGGMAVVFRARDERLQRRVALKVLAPALAGDEAFRHRFIRESLAAAAVDDPHIIPVFEAGEAEGVLFLAMRYVPGGDVRTLVRRAGPLSPAHALAIISPVASALDAAHSAGLVHRDVKLANILLDEHPGRPDHVYLSDFGLSKMVMSSLGPTTAGQFLGTPGYSAPEQLEGKQVDGRADQYSLACATFELLCGQTPFPRDQLAAVIWAHLSEPPPPLTSRRANLPPAVDGVLAKALAKDPANRYPSCQAFAEALREALGLAPYNSGSGVSPQADESNAESANSAPSGAAQPSSPAPAASAEVIDGRRAREAAKPDTALETTVSWHEEQLEAPGVGASRPPGPATPTPSPIRSSADTATTGGSHRALAVLRPHRRWPITTTSLVARNAGAVLLATSAGIHLDLYLTRYWSIPTIGWLFPLQVIAGFALAAAVLLTRSWLVAVAGAGLVLATLGGYLLSVRIGLFGFKEIRTTAGIAAGLIEIAAFATLALAAVGAALVRQAHGPVSPAARVQLEPMRAAALTVNAAVGGVSVAALVLFGIAVGSAGREPAAAAGAEVTLRAAKIGGITVLTNAKGLTLYWFALDTPATSKCTGSCTAYWPPVTSSPEAGPGVIGKLGMIKRPGGTVQATYDGHPLYTYIGDSGPGQARGNNLDLNDGYWYEVRVSG
jgi:serine/threonine protein kinase/predicted lipoprotein with Yx(FWY)xxD motif